MAEIYWSYLLEAESYCVLQALSDTTEKPGVYHNYWQCEYSTY